MISLHRTIVISPLDQSWKPQRTKSPRTRHRITSLKGFYRLTGSIEWSYCTMGGCIYKEVCVQCAETGTWFEIEWSFQFFQNSLETWKFPQGGMKVKILKTISMVVRHASSLGILTKRSWRNLFCWKCPRKNGAFSLRVSLFIYLRQRMDITLS